MTQIVDLELAKRLKEEGYSKPCEYFWLDKDLPYLPSGLKKTKNGKKMNHNKYNDFVYSAPLHSEAISWLHEKNTQYSLVQKILNNWY